MHPKSGIYHIHIRVNGIRKRFSLKTRNPREADGLRRNIERELHAKTITTRPSFEQFKYEFLEFSKTRKALATTEKERHAFTVIEKFLNPQYVDTITTRDADELITRMSRKTPEKTLSPFSVNSYLASMRSIFGTALKWGYVDANPFSKVSRVRVDHKMARVFTIDELHKIMAKAEEIRPELVQVFEFLLLTGCRRSEALDLDWKDIDFERNLLYFQVTKNRHPRQIFMVPKVVEILNQRKELPRPFDFKKHRVTTSFKTVLLECGITDAHLHNLRSSFSSHLQNEGMPRTFVSWFIGHTDEQTTQNYYTGFYTDLVKGYLLKMQERIFGAK